jgi:RecJ-like exonuclease
MDNVARLYQEIKPFCEKITTIVENNKEIYVITHLDADGIISGSIISILLVRLGAKCCVRTVSDMTPNIIDQMRAENHDFYIITDLGAGIANELYSALDNRWMIIDHHQIPKREMHADYNDHILNAWKYGIDGSREVSAGGMAYLLASALDRKNKDLSCIAVVSAMADKQDQGEKKSLIGINAEIAKAAESEGLLRMDLGLMFTGRESKPLHEAVAHTLFPYIEGLTWNSENSYTLLKNAGIKMKDNSGRWRVFSEITQEETGIILDVIAKFIATSNKKNRGVHIVEDLVGYIYILTNEDQRSQLRDAREFSTMLNACGRIRKAGVGIGICMGDRNRILSEAEKIATDYRATLRRYISTILAEKWRLVDDEGSVFINGEGIIAEDMLGAVSSLLSGSPTFDGQLLFIRTLTKDGDYKYSSRRCIMCKSEINLGLLLRHCSESIGGIGGGHSSAAGCRIPSAKLDSFLSSIRSGITSNAKFSDIS